MLFRGEEMNIWKMWEMVSEVNDIYYGIEEIRQPPEIEDEEEQLSNYWSKKLEN